MSEESNLRPVHGDQIGVPVRRKRRPLSANSIESSQRKAKNLLDLAKEREKLDRDAKAHDAKELAKKQEAAAEEQKQQAQNPDPNTSILGLKDGSAPYPQQRHAKALATKLGFDERVIREVAEGFVVDIPRNLVPANHVPLQGIEPAPNDEEPPADPGTGETGSEGDGENGVESTGDENTEGEGTGDEAGGEGEEDSGEDTNTDPATEQPPAEGDQGSEAPPEAAAEETGTEGEVDSPPPSEPPVSGVVAE